MGGTWEELPPSELERLEPERVGHVPRREVIAGVLLVLGLVVAGAWQWWRQQTALDAYHAGTRAAAQHNWEGARAAFTAAGGYSDAESRARAAAQAIADRDTQYQHATDAVNHGNWPVAAEAAGRVLALAPGYRDTGRLIDVARSHVYQAALNGGVALRTGAQPPGLYTFSGAGWAWLSGSDATSRVRAICPDSAVVFDAPGSGTATPAPGRNGRGTRVLVRAKPGRSANTPTSLAFNPNTPTQAGCTATGVWLRRNIPPWQQTAGRPFPVPAADFSLQMDGAPAPVGPPLDRGALWYVLGVPPQGPRLLMGRVDGAPGSTTLDGGDPLLHVMLALPDGSDPQPLLDQRGILLPARFSADGRFILLTCLEQSGGAAGVRVLLVDTVHPGPPVVLSAGPPDPGPFAAGVAPAALFLSTGLHAGEILLTGRDPGGRRLRLLDPTRLAVPAGQWAVPDGAPRLALVREDPAHAALLLGWLDGAGTAAITLITDDGQMREWDLALDAGTDLQDLRLHSDHLVYTTRGYDPVQHAYTYTIHSRPLTGSAPSGPSSGLYTAVLPGGRRGGSSPPAPWRLGHRLFAYTTPAGALHARTYDGSTDLLLETGVTALYEGNPVALPVSLP